MRLTGKKIHDPILFISPVYYLHLSIILFYIFSLLYTLQNIIHFFLFNLGVADR